jgi:transcriptional regulator GlxA family with amidase domain
VKTRLSQVTDWPALAREAHWNVTELARICHVSTRALQLFFLWNMGVGPKQYMRRLRQSGAALSLDGTRSVKQVAALLGYTHASHFSRDFKLFYGRPPSAAGRP